MITERKSKTNRLALEGLEDRCLLAGDVAATVVNGTLSLVGDDLDNAVSVSAALNGSGNPVANAFVVTGLGGTTINGIAGTGGANASMIFGSVGSLSADLSDGNDVFQLTNAELQHNVAISTGADNDQVWLGAFNGQPSGTTGLGAAIPGALGAAFNGLTPPTLSVAAGQVHIHGNLDVSTNSGNDQVAASNVLVDGNATIKTGSGADTVFGMALSDVVNTSAISGALAGQEGIGMNVGRRLVVDLGTNSGAIGAAVDAVFASHLSAQQGIFINGPDEAQFTLSHNTGGSAGVVLNGTVPTSNGNQNNQGDNGSAAARLERLLARLELMINRLLDQIGSDSSIGAGLTASLGTGPGNGHHWGWGHNRG